MPTYVCTSPAGLLDDTKRAAIAALVSRTHSGATGAPAFFVQTVFIEAEMGRRFIGTRIVDDHLWIRGDIRAGRSSEARARLLQVLLHGIVDITGLARQHVWIYLNELQADDMVEFGRVLPAAGAEQAWLESLPEPLRGDLEALGRRRSGP